MRFTGGFAITLCVLCLVLGTLPLPSPLSLSFPFFLLFLSFSLLFFLNEVIRYSVSPKSQRLSFSSTPLLSLSLSLSFLFLLSLSLPLHSHLHTLPFLFLLNLCSKIGVFDSFPFSPQKRVLDDLGADGRDSLV